MSAKQDGHNYASDMSCPRSWNMHQFPEGDKIRRDLRLLMKESFIELENPLHRILSPRAPDVCMIHSVQVKCDATESYDYLICPNQCSINRSSNSSSNISSFISKLRYLRGKINRFPFSCMPLEVKRNKLNKDHKRTYFLQSF